MQRPNGGMPMMTRSNLRTVVLLTVLASLLAGPAAAQDDEPGGWYMDVQRFHPSFDSLGGLQVESARTLELWHPAFGLHFNYANRPLVLYSQDGEGRAFAGAMVGDLFAMDLQAAIGFRYVDFGLTVPVSLAIVQKTDGPVAGYPNYDRRTNLGDIRFAIKGRILDPEKLPVGLAMILPFSMPTGNAAIFNGMWNWTFNPMVVVETRPGRFHAALNMGPYLTGYESNIYLDRDDQIVAQTGPEWRMALWAGYRVADPVDVHGELLMAFGMGGQASATRNPVEWRLGARIYPISALSIDLGLGSGMSPGIGAPAFRFLFGASFTPTVAKDSDKDRVPDKRDQCPSEPEDRDKFEDQDGCPDPDNDGDGVADELDQCPEEQETHNGFEDGDGCADENPDNDGDGLSNAADLCPDEAEDLDGYQDSDGCPDLDDDGDGVADVDDQCPDTMEVFNGVDDTDGCADEGGLVQLDLESGEIKLLQPLNFLSKKAVLEDDARAVLDAVSAVMLARGDLLTVEVQVHTDDVGDPDFNLRFSDARAQIIRLYLTEKGVEEGRLVAKGYGESQPLMEGTSDDARAANRRVQFMILDRAEGASGAKAPKSDFVEPKEEPAADETSPADEKAKYVE